MLSNVVFAAVMHAVLKCMTLELGSGRACSEMNITTYRQKLKTDPKYVAECQHREQLSASDQSLLVA